MKLIRPIKQDLYAYVLVTGTYGAGKSTLAHTAPGPILTGDAEGRAFVLKGKHIVRFDEWEEDRDMKLGHNSVVVLPIDSYTDYKKGVDLLRSGNHPFNTFVLDSLPEIQENMKEAIAGGRATSFSAHKKFEWDAWDKLQHFLKQDMRFFEKARRPTFKRPVNVIIVCPINTDEEPPLIRPFIQGGLRRSICGFVDIQGALHKERAVDEDGNTTVVRVLDIDSFDDSTYEAKCNIPEVNDAFPAGEIEDPDITRDIVMVMNRTNQGESE